MKSRPTRVRLLGAEVDLVTPDEVLATVDGYVREQRSAVMRKVPGKDSSAELKVRRLLTAMGLRYRLHRRDLPGSPDIAIIDAEGYCNIVGRIKDMVIRGGENIYPREIEEFLYRLPQVQDVQDQLDQIDAHYRATEPTRTGGVG